MWMVHGYIWAPLCQWPEYVWSLQAIYDHDCLDDIYLFIYLQGEFKAVTPSARLKKKQKNSCHTYTQKYMHFSNAVKYKDTY